jgi:uncharacterized protein
MSPTPASGSSPKLLSGAGAALVACNSLVVTVTERCNSNCRYCAKATRRPRDMSLEFVEKLFHAANRYLDSHPREKLSILWHGGEPLWRGPAFFESMASLQEELCFRTRARIEHCIQTNLTCLEADHLRALRRLGVQEVGTSFDPEPGIRGPGKRVDSVRYNQRFLRGLSLLERERLSWGLVYVVTRRSLARPLEVFRFLTNLNLESRVTLNPVLIVEGRGAELAISPREYIDFLGAIYPFWQQHRQRFPSVQPLESWDRALSSRSAESPTDDDQDVQLSVQPDGTVGPCLPDGMTGAQVYGRIGTDDLGRLFTAHRLWQRQTEGRMRSRSECARCCWWSVCRGGFELDAAAQAGDSMLDNGWCDARRTFFDRYFQPLRSDRRRVVS